MSSTPESKRQKLEGAHTGSPAASTPPHSRGAGGGCGVGAAPEIDPRATAEQLYVNASLVVDKHYDEDETYRDNFDVILAQMIGTQSDDVTSDDAAGAGAPSDDAAAHASPPASDDRGTGDDSDELISASQQRGSVAVATPAEAAAKAAEEEAGRLRAEKVLQRAEKVLQQAYKTLEEEDDNLAGLAQEGAEEELDGEWWLDPDEQLIELIKDDDDDGDGEGDDMVDEGGDVFDHGRIEALINVLNEYADGTELDDIEFEVDRTIGDLDTADLPYAQGYYSVLAQNLTTKTREASTIEEAAASASASASAAAAAAASAEGEEEAQVRRSTRNRAVKVATLMLPPAAKRILNLKKERKDAEKRKKAIQDIKSASASSGSLVSPGLGAAAAAKPPVLTVAAAKEQLNQLLTRAGGPRKAGRSGSAVRRVGSDIHSVVGSYATQCPGVRADIDFQKSSNTLKWIYNNPRKVNLYCYLCSLRIPDGENAHFEHVLAFLSALAKGLIPVRRYSGGAVFDICLLFVQGCLGEWAHQHCNSTCKGELDFTNNRKRAARNVSWEGLASDPETIKKVLRCIWHQTTAGTMPLRPELERIYGNYETFEAVQLPKIVYRVDMCIKMIKCFVDFERYRKTKVFLKNAGLAYANAKLKGQKYPIGPIIQSHFDRPDRHPINYKNVVRYLYISGGPVSSDIASSQKMYLEIPDLGDRRQTLVPYANVSPPPVTTDVHPTHDKTQTFGGALLGMFNCDEDGSGGGGAGSAAYGKRKGKGRSGFTEGGASPASKTRRQQRQRQKNKKLLTQKRQKPQVTVEIVPYQP